MREKKPWPFGDGYPPGKKGKDYKGFVPPPTGYLPPIKIAAMAKLTEKKIGFAGKLVMMLIYRQHKMVGKGHTTSLRPATGVLAAFGITRQTYLRALDDLEKAGFIKVNRAQKPFVPDVPLETSSDLKPDDRDTVIDCRTGEERRREFS